MSTQYTEVMEVRSESVDGIKCRDPLLEYTDAVCYTQNALMQEDLLQRVGDIRSAAPTLRRVTLIWARCYTEIPVRIVGIDLDNIPHSIDRPGGESDAWGKTVVDW